MKVQGKGTRRATRGLRVLGTAAWSLTACGIFDPGDGSWRSLGLDGKWVTAVAETPWGLFAGTRDDGVFRLDSASGEWQSLGLDHLFINAMVMIPGTPPRLLVGVGAPFPETTEAAVFATGDGGASWVPADGGLAEEANGRAAGRALASGPRVPELVYLGTCSAILRSDDRGDTWRFVLGSAECGDQGVQSIVVLPDGAVWASIIGAFGNSRILRSLDGGDTWQTFWPAPTTELGIYALAVHSTNVLTVWAGLDAGAIVTDDSGETWRASLVADYTTISALVWLGDDLMAVGMYRNFATNEAGDPVGEEINRLRLYRLPGGVGEWEEMGVPSEVHGGRSATIDSQGRLVVGTAGSGVWLWKR